MLMIFFLSKDGKIVVADRSNNRIQLFHPDGTYHSKFGSEGKLAGQFCKPSSVCCDTRNYLIVVDKDNHRIQMFTSEGKKIFVMVKLLVMSTLSRL
jgi:tripartite motif-containing protein 71